MSDDQVRLVWFGVLLLHGLGHGGAIGALAWIAARPGSATGAWTAAHTWAAPSLDARLATWVATGFWAIPLIGFVTAAYLFQFGIGAAWQPIAVGSALVSTTGIVLFFRNWALFNTLAALAVNVVVLWAVLAGHPAQLGL